MVQTVDILGVPHAYELTPSTQSPCVLVFIHGWLLSREYWRPLIQCLSPDYQCLSYDLRGFGASQTSEANSANGAPQTLTAKRSFLGRRPDASNGDGVDYVTSSHLKATLTHQTPETFLQEKHRDTPKATSTEALLSSSSRYTPFSYAQDLAALLGALDVKSAWLIGHSLGGSIALWASEQAPHRIRGVTCLNSGGGIYLKEEFEKFRAAGQQLIKFRPPWLSSVPLMDRLMARMNVAQPVDRKWGRQRLIDLVTAEADAALGTLLDSTTEEEVHQLPQLVARLKQPVYFITGADDDIMEPKYVHHLASFHSSFQCVGQNVIQIPNCGHLAMVEQPEQVAEHIRQALNTHQC